MASFSRTQLFFCAGLVEATGSAESSTPTQSLADEHVCQSSVAGRFPTRFQDVAPALAFALATIVPYSSPPAQIPPGPHDSEVR